MEKKHYITPDVLVKNFTAANHIICGSNQIHRGDPNIDTPPSPNDGIIGGEAKETTIWDRDL